MRARVRILRNYESRNVRPGTVRQWQAGQEDILVYWEPSKRTPGIWGTNYYIDEAWLIPASDVEVIEVLQP